MVFSDGSVAYGIKAYWNTGSHDWQYASSCYRPTKPIREISYHILFRKNATGKAWFDDFELRRGEPDVQIGAVTMESTAPLSQNGFFIEGMFFRNVNYKAILQDDAGNDLLVHNGTGREIRWFAEPEKKAAKIADTGFCKRKIKDLHLSRQCESPTAAQSCQGKLSGLDSGLHDQHQSCHLPTPRCSPGHLAGTGAGGSRERTDSGNSRSKAAFRGQK